MSLLAGIKKSRNSKKSQVQTLLLSSVLRADVIEARNGGATISEIVDQLNITYKAKITKTTTKTKPKDFFINNKKEVPNGSTETTKTVEDKDTGEKREVVFVTWKSKPKFTASQVKKIIDKG